MIIKKFFTRIELWRVCFLGKKLGIAWVVRYLRNPNPLISVQVLRAFGAVIGKKTTFKGCIFIDNAHEDENSSGDLSHIKIGENCYIGDGIYFDLSNEIILQDNVVISGKVSLITHSDCNRSEQLSKIFPRKCKPIIIKKGTWVGFGATILSGTTLGEHSVLASRALLQSDMEPKTVYAGIPAKKIKNIM